MTTKQIRHSGLKVKWTCFGFTLGCAITVAFVLLPGSVPVFAEAPQEDETPGLVHGVTPPPEQVEVRSLEPPPPVGEATPLQKVGPHVRNPEDLKLKKQLLEEGLIKPRTDVIEDTGDHPSLEIKKEQNP